MGKRIDSSLVLPRLAEVQPQQVVEAADWKDLIAALHYHYARSGADVGGMTWSGNGPFITQSATYATINNGPVSKVGRTGDDYDLDDWQGLFRFQRAGNDPATGTDRFGITVNAFIEDLDFRVTFKKLSAQAGTPPQIDTAGTITTTTLELSTTSGDSEWVDATLWFDVTEDEWFLVYVEAKKSGAGDGYLWHFAMREAVLLGDELPAGGDTSAPVFSGITSYDYSAKEFLREADGAAVGTWQSRHTAANATQATGANQPARQTVAGMPVLRFDGTNDNMAAAGATASSNVSIFVVAKWDTGATQGAVIDGSSGATRNTLYTLTGNDLSANCGTADVSTGTDPRGAFHLVDFHGVGAGSEVYTDGVLDGGPGNPGTQVLSGGITIGSFHDGSSLFDGDIAEIVIYDGALTAAQKQAVRDYLQSEWAALLS